MQSLRVILLAIVLASGIDACARDRQRERSDFVLAEQAVERGDAAAFQALADTLSEYPLYPYLLYQWLKKDLTQTDGIRAFLADYKNTRYAPLLREKWLKSMAAQNKWQAYTENYIADGNVALQCLYHWARFQTGFQEQALLNAKRLWMSGSSQPGECGPLFAELEKSALMSREMIWQRFEMALKENHRQLAESLARQLPRSDRDVAESWLEVDKNPERIIELKNRSGNDALSARIFAHGLDRIAKSDPDRAVRLWDAEKQGLPLEDRIKQMTERRLALALAFQRKAGAYDRLTGLSVYDGEVREWRVRAALFEQNWEHIAAAVSDLTLEELKEARWQYWQARAFEVAGQAAEARSLYMQAAKDRSFYGFLAADAVSQPYFLADTPVPLAANDLAELAAEKDFQAVIELRALNREMEAQRQWWFATGKLAREKRARAAKLAESWGWHPVAIKTLAKADYWDDLALRFPVGYLEQVRNNALRHNLDPAVVLGVIRQESMLDSHAESAVGALGLMQVMPKTGRQIAREIQQDLVTDASLFDPDVNIRLGSYYFKKLLQRFNGHVALAAAAYNAGPARATKWLPNAGAMPADIWVETIPFRETRKYVAAVLSYAVIYQHRLDKPGLKITDLMPAVPPG
ncbi:MULTISPECIES: transglycosylase SLT domain-containing protein [Methylomicrobium]|uniref:Soluble lytic murein transglycosylase-like protein n=1 Tax=Methylomicrobium album BG8 TaxID=686340 RepID=H8GP85_METAL|nr:MULTISPECIES: transglycosylase SLT domain-containing protein [Methylomicrobium]EIC29671.1 soluble lytic murein transglycosylase-like protein [Methylomicrobium album BG8]